MNSDLREAWALVDAGDTAGLMRHLYFTADGFTIGEIAPLVGRSAELAGFTDLAESLLPGRGDRALGLAASRVLGLPVEPFDPGRTDTVVIACDLGKIDDDELLEALYDRAGGQILYEYATCWTEPPAVSADVNGMLCQTAVAPWDERPRLAADGVGLDISADERTAEELAEEILRADPTPDGGDGGTPPDTDETLAGFAAAVAPLWPADGPRDRVRSPGPVRGARFL